MTKTVNVKIGGGLRWWVAPSMTVAWFIFWLTPHKWRDRLYDRYEDFICRHGIWTSVDGA